MLEERYKPLFSREIYALHEADAAPPAEPENEDEVNLDDLDLGGAEEGQPQEKDFDLSTPAPDAQGQPAPAADQPPVDNGMATASPEEMEPSEEEKEQEKEQEMELNGRVSNILSSIADTLGPETFRFYKEVEEKAIEYFKALGMDDTEKQDLLKQFPEVGLKIISDAKKNNFMSRDNIVFMAVIEGSINISDALSHREKEDEDAVSEPRKKRKT